jgi:hypothetical protein
LEDNVLVVSTRTCLKLRAVIYTDENFMRLNIIE